MQGKNFQSVVIGIFLLAAVFGVLVFSGTIPIGNDNEAGGQGTVVLWGTVRASDIATLVEDFNLANPSFTLRYVEKPADTFDQDLLEALASGVGPDMFFLPDDLILNYRNKILAIPYESFPEATFKSNFAGAGEIYLTSQGVLAFPMYIDPMVMYYSRSMLDANGIAFPPAYWDEFAELVPTLTKKDAENKIMKSAVALGQYANVAHAKDLVSALFMQAGNPIVAENEISANGTFLSTLGEFNNQYNLPSVLEFYTSFADPQSSVYSWNRSFPNSSDVFSAENLAFYFGFASELETLAVKNPNQNFLVASMPQIRGANFKLTSGRVNGIAISAFSQNINTAFVAAGLLSSGEFASRFANVLGVAPARRDLLAQTPGDPFLAIFYNSALYARSWLDPSTTNSDAIFKGMVEGVLSNSMTPEDAIRDASSKLDLLLLR